MKLKKTISILFGMLGGVTLLAAIILALSYFNFIPLSTSPFHSAADESPLARVKIKRQRTSLNPGYQRLIKDGDSALFAGNFDAARAAYQKASELEPREELPYEKIGDLYVREKKYGSAESNFELASSLNQDNAALKIKIIQSLLGQRKILNAKTAVEAIQPETQASLYYKGLIAAFLNDQETARSAFAKSSTGEAQKFLKIYKEFDIARDSRIEYLQTLFAQAFDQVGEYGLAIELAFDAIKTEPDYRDSWIILGHAFLNEDKWLDAEDALSKAISLDSGYSSSYMFRGIARRRLHKTDDAIADFLEAQKYSWQPRILLKQELAEAYFDKKEFEKAYELYKEIVETDSTDINRFIRPMALAINHLVKPAEALGLAQTAYKSHPDSAMAHNLLGWAASANGDFTGAHQHLEEAILKDPELEAAYLNLGQLAEREGNREAALANYKKAQELAAAHGDASIGNTAQVRYDAVEHGALKNAAPGAPDLTLPLKTSIPSLSLQ